MLCKSKTRVAALATSAILVTDQAFAMAWPPSTGGGSSGVPELDASGGIAVIALLVSVALVLFNRSRNR